MKISELNVSDGWVTELSIQSGVVTVVLKDWQDDSHTITFKGVVGIESYSPEGVDLCHIKVLSESKKIQKLCSIIEANEHEFKEYSFISAWNDLPVLTIFSDNVEIN